MSEFNATQFLGTQIRAAADALAAAVDALPTDRQDWRPGIDGRTAPSAVDVALDAASLLAWGERCFRDRHPGPYDEAALAAGREARRGDATMWLVEAANALSAAVAGLPTSLLPQAIRNPATGEPTNWAEFALFFQAVAVRGEGQVRTIAAYCAP